MRCLAPLTLLLVLAGCDAAGPGAPPAVQARPQDAATVPEATALAGLQAEPAPEWTALFDREQGWTGADGIYAIPLDGIDAPGAGGPTFFHFGDTAIGRVRPDGTRDPATTLVNNTLALLGGGAPDPAAIRFVWPGGLQDPRAVLVPDTPDAEPGEWYWNADGVVIDGTLWTYAVRVGPAPGTFPFEVVGLSLIRRPLVGGRPGRPEQFDTPLFGPPQGGTGDFYFGAGVLPNTVEAGAPHPDGYLYVYGVRSGFLVKNLLVARVRPEAIADFDQYRYWDGTDWVADVSAAAPVTDRVSNELSVTPLADGGYLLVFQLDALSRYVGARIGASPVGPWSEAIPLYSCPEVDEDPDYFCYNAKAHPHLSEPGTLLISYNVNSYDFGDFFRDADNYRPRFVRLTGLPQ